MSDGSALFPDDPWVGPKWDTDLATKLRKHRGHRRQREEVSNRPGLRVRLLLAGVACLLYGASFAFPACLVPDWETDIVYYGHYLLLIAVIPPLTFPWLANGWFIIGMAKLMNGRLNSSNRYAMSAFVCGLTALVVVRKPLLGFYLWEGAFLYLTVVTFWLRRQREPPESPPGFAKGPLHPLFDKGFSWFTRHVSFSVGGGLLLDRTFRRLIRTTPRGRSPWA